MTTSHMVADLANTADGRTELMTLTASGGITYEEAKTQFAGSELFYDAVGSVITVKGNDFQPCLLNGSAVDGIRYDLKTGKVKAKIVGGGLFGF